VYFESQKPFSKLKQPTKIQISDFRGFHGGGEA